MKYNDYSKQTPAGFVEVTVYQYKYLLNGQYAKHKQAYKYKIRKA